MKGFKKSYEAIEKAIQHKKKIKQLKSKIKNIKELKPKPPVTILGSGRDHNLLGNK